MDYLSNIIHCNRAHKAELQAPHHFYSTHPDSVRSFLDVFLKQEDHHIRHAWEPAAGRLNISRVLNEYGIGVQSSDLVPREYLDKSTDFLKCETLIQPNIEAIITNPPYNLHEPFIRKALELRPSKFVIMYLKLTCLEGKGRFKLYEEFPLYQVYVHSSRQKCDEDGATEFDNGKSAVCYCWYVWKMDYTGDTVIKLLAPN